MCNLQLPVWLSPPPLDKEKFPLDPAFPSKVLLIYTQYFGMDTTRCPSSHETRCHC